MTKTTMIDLAFFLAQTANMLWNCVLCPDQTSDQFRVYEFMRLPQPGSLVFENSSGLIQLKRGNKEGVFKAVGWIDAMTREPIETEWDEEHEGRPKPTENVVYIRTLDGERVRWTNCAFLAIPTLDILSSA